MSQPGDNGALPESAAFDRLEAAVSRLVDEITDANRRADAAAAKNAELSELVQRFTGNEESAGELMTRLKTLESENAELRGRLDAGRDGVERMIARINFLENQG